MLPSADVRSLSTNLWEAREADRGGRMGCRIDGQTGMQRGGDEREWRGEEERRCRAEEGGNKVPLFFVASESVRPSSDRASEAVAAREGGRRTMAS